jgi:hypothetical protein
VAIFLENVVTNAVESAPSAKRSRSKFGVRKATVNASISLPPPKEPRKDLLADEPSTRLHITAIPTMPAALVLTLEGCASIAGETADAVESGVEGGSGTLPAESVDMFGGSLAETVHDGNPESMLGHRFGEDEIEPGFVEPAEFGEERGCGFAEIAGREISSLANCRWMA